MRPRDVLGTAAGLFGAVAAAALCLVLVACAFDGGRPEIRASGVWDVGIGVGRR